MTNTSEQQPAASTPTTPVTGDCEPKIFANYHECIRGLDSFYGQVKRQILRYQSPTTGLFPSMSNDQSEAVIRDSIYCSVAVWSLYQAYIRRVDDDHGKTHELGQSVVKCMRGILLVWMRQSKDKVEQFKGNQNPKHALSSKVNLNTSLPLLNDTNYGHLQLDVVSLYLVFLVQMITSGLQLIYTMDEVQFIQNLVYYVERTYRTPDFGMWERGSKYNDGTPEIHASSIGMAKSALESINGCNLFGDKGGSWSVIHVDVDAHSRNRNTFETLLPRESSSKNTDASLLPTISWPCFATHDPVLYGSTKEKILEVLKTPYGYKRFLRDGYGTTLELTAKYYSQGETKYFENIECAWPIFCCFLIIDAIFTNNDQQLNENKQLLFGSLLQTESNYGDYIMPKYYYVPKEYLEMERNKPNSAPRFSCTEGNNCDSLYLMGQSVLTIARLLMAGFLNVNELDPIRRYTPSYERNFWNRKIVRNSVSVIQGKLNGSAADQVVQVVLIAESIRLKAMLATYGIQTQTPQEVEPVQIWAPSQLVKVYEYLGINKQLGLKGRPPRPIGSLGTSKLYRILGHTVLCYPLIFENSDFYLSYDMALLIDDIKNELNFVGKYWRMTGRPTVCLILREEHLRDINFKEMLYLLVEFKKGFLKSSGLKIKIGRLQNLISSSCIEHLDFFHQFQEEDLPKLSSFKQLEHKYEMGYQSLTNIQPYILYSEQADVDYKQFEMRPTWPDIMDALKSCKTLFGQSQLLRILLNREGLDFQLPSGNSVRNQIEKVSRQAGGLHYWPVVRFCSSILKKLVDSISPSISSILVNAKQITIGTNFNEVLIDHPRTPKEIHQLLYSTGQDVYDSVLQQEIILYVGQLISTAPHLFNGIFKIRIGSGLMQAMKFYLSYENGNFDGEGTQLECLSPNNLRRLLNRVLTDKNLSPHQTRQIDGSLGRFPKNFSIKVWDILQRSRVGISIGNNPLLSNYILSQMSSHDMSYIVEVENFILQIQSPEYRQILVELLMVIHAVLERNPEFVFSQNESVNLDKFVERALHQYQNDRDSSHTIVQFYSETRNKTSSYFARAVLDSLLQSSLYECKIS